MKKSFESTHCCHHGSPDLGVGQGCPLEEPAAENLHGGVCEGGVSRDVMANLNGHATGNGGYGQGTPTAHWGSSTRREGFKQP
jgi:hypothetical protein